MKLHIILAFIVGLTVIPAGAQPLKDSGMVFPLRSPLKIQPGIGGADEGVLDVEYGVPLPLVRVEEAHVDIRLPDGAIVSVGRSSVVGASEARTVVSGDRYGISDRVRLPFWDSLLRAEAYLADGPSPGSNPVANEVAITDEFGPLVVTDVATVETELGPRVSFARSLVPFEADALFDPGTRKELHLHIVADASQYAKPFTEEKLAQLSRFVSADPLFSDAQVALTIFSDTGGVSETSNAAISDLRRILPEGSSASTRHGGLSVRALRAMERALEHLEARSDRSASHVILVLMGSGISARDLDPDLLRRISGNLSALSANGNDIGVIVASATPEPSETPTRIVSSLRADIPTGLVEFNESLFDRVGAVVSELEAGSVPDPSMASACGVDPRRSFPCISINDRVIVSGLRSQRDLDWIALSLWHAVDGEILKFADAPGENSNQAVAEMPGIEEAVPSKGKAIEAITAAQREAEENLRAELSAEREKRITVDSRLIEATEMISQLELGRATLLEEITRLEGERQRALTELAASGEALRASDARVSELETLVAGRQDALDEATEAFKAERQAVEALERQQASLQTLLEEARARERRLSRDLDGARQQAAALDRELEARDRENRAFSEELALAREDYEALQGRLEEIDGIREAQVFTIQRLEGETESLEHSREELQQDIEAFDAVVRGLEADREGLRSRLAEAKSEKMEMSGELAALEDQFEAARQAHVQEIERLSGQLVRLEDQLSAKDDQAREQQNLLALREDELDRLRRSNERLNDQLMSATNRIRQFEVDMAAFESAGLDERLQAQAAVLSAVRIERDRLAARIESVEGALARIGRRMAGLPGDVEYLSAAEVGDVGALNDAIASLLQDLEAAQEALGAEKRANAVATRNLNETLVQKENRVEELESQLSRVSAENRALQDQMEVARGVADENLELVRIIQKAEQAWSRRENELRTRIGTLQEQLASRDEAGAEVVRASIPAADASGSLLGGFRPNSRPPGLVRSASERDPSGLGARAVSVSEQPAQPVVRERSQPQVASSDRERRALPGSLFLNSPRQTQGGSGGGLGFFSN